MAGSNDKKAELIAQLAVARAELYEASTSVRHEANVPRRLTQNFGRHMLLWLGGAAIAGILLARIPRRTKKVYVDTEGNRVSGKKVAEAGLLAAALKIGFDVARPMLMRIAMDRLRPMVEEYLKRRQRAA